MQKESLEARKNRDAVKSSLLTTIIAQVKGIAIDDGHRAATDADVLKVVRQFLKSCDENLSLAAQGKMPAEKAEAFKTEKSLLESYLPKQMNSDELKAAIQKSGAKNMGEAMKYLKEHHDGQYDGKLASGLVKETLGI